MSSVQGTRKCPKCGGVFFYDMDCRAAEGHGMCLRCGYEQRCVLFRNDDGTLKMDEAGNCLMDIKESVGYGAARLRCKDGFGRICRFDAPLTGDETDALRKELQNPDIDKGSYAVLFDPQSGAFTVLGGELPEDCPGEKDERIKRQA